MEISIRKKRRIPKAKPLRKSALSKYDFMTMATLNFQI